MKAIARKDLKNASPDGFVIWTLDSQEIANVSFMI